MTGDPGAARPGRAVALDRDAIVAAIDGTLVGAPSGGAVVADASLVRRLVSLGSVLARRADADAAAAATVPTAHAADAVVVLASASELASLHAAVARGDAHAPCLVVVGRDVEPPASPPALALVAVADTRLALAHLSALFDTRPAPASGVHPSAVVDPTARVAADVALGPGAVVAAGAAIGAGSVLGANAYVGAGTNLGDGCVLHPGVCLYDGVTLGDRVVLHAGVVIGADGFGYVAGPRGAVKLRHSGGVVVHDDVEIGANTAVDRGTLDDTVIGPRSKIDNLCQIGHNVVIGSDCLIAGTAAVGGSSVIGNGVIIGGNVAVSDHVTIHDGARIAGRSGVTKDVPAGETWAGFPARPYRQFARSLYLLDRLEQVWQFVKQASSSRSEE